MKEVSQFNNLPAAYKEFSDLLKFIFKNYTRQILIEELAKIRSISVKIGEAF